MAQQNIFDNEVFFEGYQRLREKESNANDLFELPAILSLLPDLTGRRVLDLGCGFGEHCTVYVKRGAARVVGVDLSEKMLAVARKENSGPGIEYLHMPMEELGRIGERFDAVISSLALHYVEDFSGVVKQVYDVLTDGGVFLFSQEHPLCTCYSGTVPRWTRDETGKKSFLNLADYGTEGERTSAWFVENVQKYHRMFSTVLNTLIDAGFRLERILEPLPSPELLEKYPEHADLFHKPDFLLVKAVKR